MDLGTIGGFVTVVGLILAGILMGSSLMIFVDPASIAIVVAGTIAILFVGFPAGNVMSSLKGAKNALFPKSLETESTVKALEELSNRARREGLLSLEEAAATADDEFLARGLRMMADGHEASTMEGVLYDEIGKMEERHRMCIDVWSGMGDFAPAMGMIGTLIGLVQMLQQMDDPNAIGPAMAVALLTTFYGSLMANLLGMPISNKMKIRSAEEVAHKELIAQGLMSILNGENPRFMVERLNSTLAPTKRLEVAA